MENIRPEVVSDEDFNIEIHLEELNGFDLEFEECEKYRMTIIPSVNQELRNMTITELFTYIVTPKPPMKLNITDITESSFVVNWASSGCSEGTEIVLVKDDNTWTKVNAQTMYRVMVTGRDKTNTTLYQSLGHCTGASDQQKIELVPLDITPHSFTLLAAMNDTNDTEDIIEHIEVSVICKQEGGENSYERTGHGTQFVLNHLEPDIDYNCATTPK